jgi:hypothetical protein
MCKCKNCKSHHRAFVAKTVYKFFKCKTALEMFNALKTMTPTQQKYITAFAEFADNLD